MGSQSDHDVPSYFEKRGRASNRKAETLCDLDSATDTQQSSVTNPTSSKTLQKLWMEWLAQYQTPYGILKWAKEQTPCGHSRGEHVHEM